MTDEQTISLDAALQSLIDTPKGERLTQPTGLPPISETLMPEELHIVAVKRDGLGYIKGIVVFEDERYVAYKCQSVMTGPDLDVAKWTLDSHESG